MTILGSQIKSSINVDLKNRTCSLTLQSGDEPISIIEYKDSDKTVYFNKRDVVQQKRVDILNYLSYFTSFNSTIVSSFRPETSYNSINWNKIAINLDKTDKFFSFYFGKDNKELLSIKTDLKTKDSIVEKRTQEINLTFQEWDFFLKVFKYYVRRLP